MKHDVDALKTQVFSIIQEHGSENPVTSRELEAALHIGGALVRDIVRELRRDPDVERRRVGIISHRETKQGGYFIIKTRVELEDTIQNLKSRALSMHETISKMEEVKFSEAGQLNLL